jgi:hypothetical protein
MDAVFIGKMSIASKRHITQIVKQLIVCCRREPVEYCSQLFVLPTVNVHADSIALFRCSLGVEPICSRKLYHAAFQVGVSHFVMLLGRHVVLHWRVTNFRDSQIAAQTKLVKRRSFGTYASNSRKGVRFIMLVPCLI